MDNFVKSSLLKLALLGIPAALALVVWQRRGVKSGAFYRISWSLLAFYLVWLALYVLLPIPAVWILSVGVFSPAVAVCVALGLVIVTFQAQQGERGCMAIANLCTFLLWGMSIIPPN